MLLTEKILTPRADIAASMGVKQQPLLDSPRLARVQAVWLQGEPTRSAADVEELRDEVGGMTRQSLRFGVNAASLFAEVDDNDLFANPVTNCYGYTLCNAELLDKLGVLHTVHFVREHAFNMLWHEGSGKAYAISDADKALSVEISSAILGDSPLQKLNNGSHFTDNKFDVAKLVELVKDQEFERDLTQGVRPWLLCVKAYGSRVVKDDDKPRFIRSYQAAVGQKVLWGLLSIKASLSNQDYQQAADDITALEGIYPFVDPHEEHQLLKATIRGLGIQRAYDRMVDVTHAVHLSLGSAALTRSAYIYPDMLRRVGHITKDPELLRSSIEVYNSLRGGGDLRIAKIKKAQRLLSEQFVAR
jgi:hypothetical protein